MKMPTFAVATDSTLYYFKVDEYGEWKFTKLRYDIKKYFTAKQIIDLLYELNISRIWFKLSDENYEIIENTFFTDVTDCDVYPKSFEKVYYVEGHKTVGDFYRKKVGIAFLNSELAIGDLGLKESDNILDVFAAIYYAELLLKVPIQRSMGNMGQSLIKQLAIQHNRTYTLMPTKKDYTLFRQVTGLNKNFGRKPTKEELNKKYVYSIDINAFYLNGTRTNLGIGDYIHVKNEPFHHYKPGLWYVKINGTSIFDGKMLPYPCSLLEYSTEGLLYTSTVKFLIDLGYDVEIKDAYIWPISCAEIDNDEYSGSYSKILENWSNILGKAYHDIRTRKDFKNKRGVEIAKTMIKHMYSKALSRLSHDEAYEDSSDIDRTDWYHIVLSEADMRINRIIEKLAQIGMYPLFKRVDALWYASDEENVENAFHNLLRMEVKPGHFKEVYKLPMEKCKDILTSDNSFNKKLSDLAKIAIKMKEIE